MEFSSRGRSLVRRFVMPPPYLDAGNLWWITLAGAGTGVLGAMLGTGGGVFLIPVLVFFVEGMDMHHAIATSIVSVIATSSAVASTNVERGTANMRLGMTLEVGTTLGAIAGAITARLLHARVLEAVFAVVLLPTAFLMARGRTETADEPEGDKKETKPNSTNSDAASPGVLGGSYVDEAEGRTIVYRVRRLWAGLGISFIAGNLSGLLGIGGGVFKVPALHLLCDVPMKAAAATSNFMIGVTAAASATLYFAHGSVRPALTAAVVLGVLIGSALGTLVNRRVRASAVRLLFAVLLVAVAGQMLYRAWSRGE
jgi:uncharacterized membrane protein YfcA